MRPWRLRLATRRSRVQWALLSVVLLVSVLSATLLGTLSLLAAATETFAARSAMDGAPAESIRITHRTSPSVEGSLDSIESLSQQAVTEQLGAIPFASHIQVASHLLVVPREDRPIALGYVGASDRLQEVVDLLAGEWPQATGSGPIEVIVPPRLLWDLEAEVGDVLELAPVSSRDSIEEVRIVGTYAAIEPETDAWRYDAFDGFGYRPGVAVPFTGGLITTDGYGPLFTDLANADTFPIETITTEYIPDFSGASTDQLRVVIERATEGERIAQRTIGGEASNVTMVSVIDQTLGAVVGSLAVTRSSVLVTGLLLLVLAIAALSQTARLMAERRHAEQHLMVARGGSVRQMVWLAFVEALGLAVLTTAVAAPLARLAYLQLSQVPAMANAGMNRDPGLPVATWVVTGVVGFALLLVLVLPLLRRTGSFVDAEQSKSRPGRRAAFQRSGLDLAVVVVAVLAYWQLRSYRSPVMDQGGVATVDPLLAAGPALALLAGALVAVRLIPATSKMLEGLASRGRRAVMPLASWEVGRRSARAVSAVLLLTLALSIGTFALSFLITWQNSQYDQARFQHPADAIATGVEGAWLTQWSQVANESLDANPSAVYSRATEMDAQAESSRRNQANDRFNGYPVTLVATDNDGLKFFGLDRLHDAGGSRVPTTLARSNVDEVDAIELPGNPEGLRLTVTPSVSNPQLTDGFVVLRAVLRDSTHNYQTVDMGRVPIDGKEHVMSGRIGDRAQVALMDGPLSLVGLQVTFGSTGEAVITAPSNGLLGFTVRANIEDIEVITPIQAIPVEGVPDIANATAVEVPSQLGWAATATGLTPQTASDPDNALIAVEAISTPTAMRLGGARLVLTAAPVMGQLPLVASGGALDAQALDVGDAVRISVNDTLVDAYIAQRIPRLPGETLRTAGIAAHLEDLQLALIQSGGPSIEATQWWITLPDENLEPYVAQLPEEITVTSRAGLAEEFTLDPLRIGIQAALWLVAGAAAVLAAVGFAVHAVVTVRAREIEFAQLRAVGIQRGQLLRVVASESVLLSILGVIFGVGLGIALAFLVAPLVSVGADGRAPIPSVEVMVPWGTVSLLALEVVMVVSVTMVIVAAMLRRINPAQMLRLGDER